MDHACGEPYNLWREMFSWLGRLKRKAFLCVSVVNIEQRAADLLV
jgi:uncharacterized membrane protein YhaH (DUF805 family)